MKITIVTALILFTHFSFGQTMENTFFTWDDFVENFGKEMVSAEDVYNQMVKIGLVDNSMGNFDFHFISDKKENLEKLKLYISDHYPYEIKSLEKIDKKLWELHGVTNEIPVTNENLMYWGLDMYKRGYEFDSKLDGYGASIDHKNPKFPDFDKSKQNFYFNKGLECYNSGDLSGAIINWSNTVVINPNDADAYYSRAIVKNELYTWKAALEDYNKAIEIEPGFLSALTNRGSLKDDNGDHHGAIEDYNKVIQSENASAEDEKMAYFNRGNSKFNLKDMKGACADWKKAYELGAEYAIERINQYCNK